MADYSLARAREVANVWNIVAVSSLVAAAAMADDYPNHRDHYQHGFNVDIVVISSCLSSSLLS